MSQLHFLVEVMLLSFEVLRSSARESNPAVSLISDAMGYRGGRIRLTGETRMARPVAILTVIESSAVRWNMGLAFKLLPNQV